MRCSYIHALANTVALVELNLFLFISVWLACEVVIEIKLESSTSLNVMSNHFELKIAFDTTLFLDF